LVVSPIARRIAILLLASLMVAPVAEARTLRVGPERNYKHFRDASLAARDGDVILVDAGVYTADVCTWSQNDLVIWAPGGRARIEAAGANEGGKGTWVVEGRNFTAENIEFSGARVPDHNGAGVRIHAKGKVTLRNCYFHDNEMGVLGDADEILIDRCIFDRNGTEDRIAFYHNIYLWGPQVTVQNCYIRRATGGHNLKTRGLNNYILANRIMDEADGTGSYSIDVPDCGRTYIIGNVIEQGPMSPNYHMISYGSESDNNKTLELYVINNTLINNGRADGFYMKIHKGTRGRITNNIFYGPGTTWVGGSLDDDHNQVFGALDNQPRFRNPRTYDFRLTPESPRSIVDRGAPPGVSSMGYDLRPKLEYVYDANGRNRPVSGPLDLGAFEYVAARIEAPKPLPSATKPKTTATTSKKKKTPRTYPAKSPKSAPTKR
jgi:parallel beta helix pectate lyase-like protein